MPRHRLFVGQDPHKFSIAHMTVFPDGTKEKLHGHNYNVSVSLELTDVSLARMIDFGIIKRALEAQCREWNEHLVLGSRCPALEILRHDDELEFKLAGKRYVVPAEDVILLPVENVIVETLSMVFAERFAERLSGVITRDSVPVIDVEVSEMRGQGGSYRWVWPAAPTG